MTPNTTAIVGGQFKGTRLRTGRDRRIRPTVSRVREAIFDLLPSLSGTDVLDLYAGAGTLGFEALSRGAGKVTFVELNPHALRLLEKNRIPFDDGRVKIIRDDCLRFLKKTGATYHVILADPPYGEVDLSDLKEGALLRLKPGGTLVVETSVRQSWKEEDAIIRRYGDTQVTLIRGRS
ncbi:MAG: RsmD family RNA methyltransferase [Fidelibacterota bacterium]